MLSRRVCGSRVRWDVAACRRWPSSRPLIRGCAIWVTGSPTPRVSHVAMEATGIYWRPVFFVLETDFELLLVNAAHVKNVPGRKTDVADATWLAQLLECGLLRSSFVPPPDIRRLRNLTRYARPRSATR